MKFYENCIELSDEHLIWKLNNPSLNERQSENLYKSLIDDCIIKFNAIYGTPFYMNGRSGRHICVEDTPSNRRNYSKMKSTIERLQKWLVKSFNNYQN